MFYLVSWLIPPTLLPSNPPTIYIFHFSQYTK
jgi:hypothetical protein